MIVRLRPIGYMEVQRGWMGRKSADEIQEVVREARASAARDYPHMVQSPNATDTRIEHVKDGAGEDHYTLYMGFVPVTPRAPPMNPRNLNEADEPQIGNAVVDFSIGMKEQKF